MKPKWWRWGYVPVVLVLGLIWYEFWRSGALSPPAPRDAAPEQVTGSENPGAGGEVPSAVAPVAPPAPTPTPVPAPPVAATVGSVALNPATVPAGHPAVPAAAVVAEGAPLDDAFFNNPPGISLSCKNASMEEVVAALRDSFKMPSNLQYMSRNGGVEPGVTLEVSNKPFWEVIKAVQGQRPLGIASSASGLMLTSTPPVYHYEISGPAIMYATQATLNRTTSGQRDTGDASRETMNVTMAAAIDPRIIVSRGQGLDVLESTDENGRTLVARGGSLSSPGTQSNFFQGAITIQPSEPMPRRLNLKCQLRFTAQLPTGSVTVEDATQKVGTEMKLGERTLRLARFEVQGTTVHLMLTSAEGFGGSSFNVTITDGNGRTTTVPAQQNSERLVGMGTASPPYRLVIRDPSATKDLAFAFELKDIALP